MKRLDWAGNVVIMQPWGDEGRADRYVRDCRSHARRLKELGFNSIILMPAPAHNDISRRHYTEEEFQEALRWYRRTGMKVLIYSCHLHVGHDPSWHRVVKEHPDWLHRTPDGKPVHCFGDWFLCPNNDESFEYTTEYTAGLVRRYDPDCIMMDNNGIPVGTCYCAACREKFRRYVLNAYSPAEIRRRFGVEPDRVDFPATRTILHEEYLKWDDIARAEVTRKTRDRLKAVKADLVFVTNTSYGFRGGLRTELYEPQDAVFSENSCADTMSLSFRSKAALTLGESKPVWHYLATWKEPEKTRAFPLLEPSCIESGIATTLAHQANPWIVSYGLDILRPGIPQTVSMRRYFRFRRQNAGYFAGCRSIARLGLFCSRHTANHEMRYRSTPEDEYRWAGLLMLLNRCALFLQEEKIPYDVLAEKHLLDARNLSRYTVLLIPDASCLTERETGAFRSYLEKGGTILTTPEFGSCDEYGRRRTRSFFGNLYRQALRRNREDIRVGKGLLRYPARLAWGMSDGFRRGWMFAYPQPHLMVSRDPGLRGLAEKMDAARVLALSNCPLFVEVVPFVQGMGRDTRFVLHVLNHNREGTFKGIGIRLLPKGSFRPKRVLLLSPDQTGKKELAFRFSVRKGTSLVLPELRRYAVVVLSAGED